MKISSVRSRSFTEKDDPLLNKQSVVLFFPSNFCVQIKWAVCDCFFVLHLKIKSDRITDVNPKGPLLFINYNLTSFPLYIFLQSSLRVFIYEKNIIN
jgi:hypothetical protein